MKVGDTVRITDAEECYLRYDEFLLANSISFDKWMCKRSAYRFMDEKYIITYIGNHTEYSETIVYIIENNNHKFIIDKNGLQLIQSFKQYR